MSLQNMCAWKRPCTGKKLCGCLQILADGLAAELVVNLSIPTSKMTKPPAAGPMPMKLCFHCIYGNTDAPAHCSCSCCETTLQSGGKAMKNNFGRGHHIRFGDQSHAHTPSFLREPSTNNLPSGSQRSFVITIKSIGN